MYDELGTPLVGVLINEQRSQKSTISEIDGSFLINVANENAILEFTSVGYDKKTVSLDKKDLSQSLKVILKLNTKLQEVEVTMPSKSVKKNEYTTNDSEELAMYADQSVGRMAPIMNVHEERPPEDGNYNEIREQSFFDPRNEPLSTLSIDVDRASYSNVRRFLQQGILPNPDAVRIEEMINYFNYDYAQPDSRSTEPFAIQTTLTDCPWNQQHQLLHVGMQAKKMARDEIPPSNFVFLIYVSGSMSSTNKLPLLKSAFKLLVNQLTEEDQIAIVVYVGAAGCVLESTPGSEKEKILDALNNLKSGGSTAGAAGSTSL